MEKIITLDDDLMLIWEALASDTPMPQVEGEEVVVPMTKHLPGQHDQSSHGSWARGHGDDLWEQEPKAPVVDFSVTPGFLRTKIVIDDRFGTGTFGDTSKLESVIQQAYAMPGFRVDVAVHGFRREDEDHLVISGGIYPEGEEWPPVGSFSDSIYWARGDSGDDYLMGDKFYLDDEYQNKDIAKGVALNKLRMAHELGLDYMKFDADSTIGTYAWAKYGASYANPAHAESASNNFMEWAVGQDYPEPSTGWPTFKTPYDVATYKHPEGHTLKTDEYFNPSVASGKVFELGKAFMLDYYHGHKHWHAKVQVNWRDE